MANSSSAYNFKFSVIMPVYNTEPWLKEAVDSVVNQDIGFKNNIQIIFINDGSTDKSEEVCLSYQKRYPKNIVYKKQKNNGFAAARNAGLKLAEAKYISFLDSDDKLSPGTFSQVYDFFEKHHSEIDLVSIKMDFFEARTGPHTLNYKFEQDAIIDVKQQYDFPQLSAKSSFFKASAFGKLRFDPNLRISEDAQLVPRFICQKLKYGVLAGPTYFHRRRIGSPSIMDNKFKSDYWFTDVVPGVYEHLFEWSRNKFGSVLKFIQYLVLYDLKVPMIAGRPEGVLTDHQFEVYKKRLHSLIEHMDDDVILLQRDFNREYKYHLLAIKHGEPVITNASRKGFKFYYRGNKIYDYQTQEPSVYIKHLQSHNGTISVMGRFTGFLFKGVTLELYANGIKVDVKNVDNTEDSAHLLGDLVHNKNYFETNIEILDGVMDLRAYVNVGGDRISLPIRHSDRQRDGIEQGNTDVFVYGNHLVIEAKDADDNSHNSVIDLNSIATRRTYRSGLLYTEAESGNSRDKILLTKELERGATLVVYTSNNQINYYLYPDDHTTPYGPLISVQAIALHASIVGKKMRIIYAANIINPYKIPIDEQYVYIDDANMQKCHIKQSESIIPKARLLKSHLHFAGFGLRKLLKGKDIDINSGIKIRLVVKGRELSHAVSVRDRKLKNPLLYYLPKSRARLGGYVAYLRSNNVRSLILVRRPVEEAEKNLWFRVLESRTLSFALYHLASIVKRLRKKQVNLYYEKNAEKADEGAFEVFQTCKENAKHSSNYFIITKGTPDYARIGNEVDVVAKYSLKYYWLIYRSDNLIATEAPTHLNIIRTNNKYMRRTFYEKRFVFLQHGITYLKSQTSASALSRGKDSEPTYMLVSSEKEQTVVSKMLKLPKEKLLITGLPVFDTIKHNHITKQSQGVVTVMLTWRPYEEHISDFTKTSYYEGTIALAKLLNKFMPPEKIRLVAHPKVSESLKKTGLANVWEGNIPDAFKDCKLVITDYSSISYYSFYQGAAVIFYQPDLEIYQEHVGRLIPKGHEYIGHRAFSLAKLRGILEGNIRNGEIDLDKLRNSEFVERYKQINKFNDGHNVQRICSALIKKGII